MKDVLILDGGPCRVGLESTVLDLRPTLDNGLPRVLRPGSVTSARLAEILEIEVEAPVVSGQGDAPGTHTSHYAPVTPLRRCELAESGGDHVAVVVVGGTGGEEAGGLSRWSDGGWPRVLGSQADGRASARSNVVKVQCLFSRGLYYTVLYGIRLCAQIRCPERETLDNDTRGTPPAGRGTGNKCVASTHLDLVYI